MARTYAGILGLVALLTSLARGLIHAHQTDAILVGAWQSLLMFAAVGYLAGWIAGRIVEESVNTAIKDELAREEPTEKSPAAA